MPYTSVYGSTSNITTLGEFTDYISGLAEAAPGQGVPYIFTELDSARADVFKADLMGIRDSALLALLPTAMTNHFPQFYLGMTLTYSDLES